MPIKHSFTNPRTDGPDSTITQPSHWNANHTSSDRATAVFPQGTPITGSTTNSAASQANAIPIFVPSAMQVRSLMALINTNNTGQIQWGVFDLSASSTAANKLVGGLAAPGGTSWQALAASGAPVLIVPGWYMLITLNPAANSPTWQAAAMTDAAPWNHYQSAYTWTDTPNFTTGWGAGNTTFRICYLEGDLDNSANPWH